GTRKLHYSLPCRSSRDPNLSKAVCLQRRSLSNPTLFLRIRVRERTPAITFSLLEGFPLRRVSSSCLKRGREEIAQFPCESPATACCWALWSESRGWRD